MINPELARVVAAHGRHYWITLDDRGGGPFQCVVRGKLTNLLVGDRVQVVPTAIDEYVVEKALPRFNAVTRADHFKARGFAANVTQIMLVIAPRPWFDDGFISRAYCLARALDLPLHLICTKADLQQDWTEAGTRLNAFDALDLPRHFVSTKVSVDSASFHLSHISAIAHASSLLPLLADNTTLLMGQSGMGKSSLINALMPHAKVATQVISAALNSGKHTTTFSQLHRVSENCFLVDTPGFTVFGLAHLAWGEVVSSFPEFQTFLPDCRFYNCRHLDEPQCGVLTAVAQGKIAASRYQHFTQLYREAEAKTY